LHMQRKKGRGAKGKKEERSLRADSIRIANVKWRNRLHRK